MNRRHAAGLAVVALVALGGCASSANNTTFESALNDDAITVGSFNFAESTVLAEVYSQALEANGYTVIRAFDLGTREFVAPALQRGLIEFVPEYAGTATTFLSLGLESPGDDAAMTHEQLVRTLESTSMGSGRITALSPAPAEDVNTIAVSRDTADRLGLRSISDLAPHAHELTLGGPKECPTRPLCGQGLRDRYGLEFKAFVALDTGGPVTRQALQTGAIDVGVLFSTDPAIDGATLVALEDDRGLQPADNITPLLRTEAIERWGSKLTATIDAVSARLTTADVRNLDKAMEVDQPDVAVIAAGWLKAQDLP